MDKSFVLREDFKNKFKWECMANVQLGYMLKKILFFKTFSKIERECYREPCEGLSNDVKAS